jgi:hypothetical protein
VVAAAPDMACANADTLEVEFAHELHAEQARLELDPYLRVSHVRRCGANYQ